MESILRVICCNFTKESLHLQPGMNRIPQIIIVSLLIASYGVTMPVLSIFHTHGVGGGPNAAVFKGAPLGTLNMHDMAFCGLCFRMNSTQTYLTFPDRFGKVNTEYEVVVHIPAVSLHSTDHALTHNRAPPSVDTLV
jgi:hypothetical protein